ncbi:LysM peptidoglycan-binding domain-containing protein [bacterium]|nr:LysM peptidoglycan-binding domain-containing protein [bacterium]
MKSSTLRRSNLSKEKMAMLEELSRNKKQSNKPTPDVYVRNNKEKELDVLWQNFRVNQKEDKFPGIYFITGVIVGAIATLAIVAILGLSFRNGDTSDFQLPIKSKAEKAKLTFIPSDKSTPEEASANAGVTGMTADAKGNQNYTVKTGDTLEGIIVRFYGKYDLSKVEKIKVANKLADPNNLQIGQKLIIPMD